MICQDCQHPNPEENRFCGKCGALLPPSPASKAIRTAQNGPAAPSVKPQAPARREPTPARRHEPQAEPPRRERNHGVSGPSFLGLNDASEDFAFSERDDLYQSNWGGRLAIALIVLLVAGALAFLQWRSSQQQARPAAPPPVASPEQAPPVNSPPSDPPVNGQNAGAQSSPNSTPASSAAQTNTPNAASATPSKATESAAAGKATAETQHSDSNNPASQLPAWPGTTIAENASESSQRVSNQAKSESDVPESDDAESEQSRGRESAPSAADQSKRESAQDGQNSEELSQSQVRWAEVYLEGKGVPQNCDEGIGILRAAEARGNIPALVKLGALYATGSCVPVSRVVAYHYFTRAYHLEPRNQSLDHSRVMLWADMSDSEKEQATNQDGSLQQP